VKPALSLRGKLNRRQNQLPPRRAAGWRNKSSAAAPDDFAARTINLLEFLI
jgi:hypothetical protein